ncbi:MAG: hypothetical protein LC793_18635 [Thermomicrobia bacterium]|nr:hypothetical protein [Thermomicrobia bacterium]MCA1724023.1 hypothetical protein [Thermomicrobia bacterium]
MRLISWNVARAGQTRIPYQVAALAARAPDIVALQEVRVNRIAEYRSALERAGFVQVMDGFAGACADHGGKRASGVLIASRWACAVAPTVIVPWPERLLSVAVATAWGVIELHTIYVPVGHGGRDLNVRIQTLERPLRATDCRYLDTFRTVTPERYAGLGFNKLSDHAAMEVDFAPEELH